MGYLHRAFVATSIATVTAHAYMLGDDTQLCWVGGVLSGNNAQQCAQYGGIEVEWVVRPGLEQFSSEPEIVSCSLSYNENMDISMGEDGATPVAHINIHSCDSDIEVCVPSIGSDIATHSPAQSGLAGVYEHELKLFPAGIWSTICHGRIFVDLLNDGNYVQVDAAVNVPGIVVTDRPPDQTYIYIIVGVIGGVTLISIVAAFFIVRYIKKNSAVLKYVDLKYDPTKIFKETGVSLIFLGTYMGTEVAIKQIKTKKQIERDGLSHSSSSSSILSDKRTISLKGLKASNKIVPTTGATTSAGQSTIAMDNTMNQDGLKAIKTEIKLLNKIRHPNCVLFLGASYNDNNIYMITEYMSHGALGEILVNPSITIDLKTKVKIALDISNGVNYLHSLTPALLHADIKSYNVFVNADLRGKIGDFGSTTVEGKNTRTGTPFWMAPELLNSSSNSKATDVYALAITYWELFARETLYADLADATLEELAEKIKGGKRPSLNSRVIHDEYKGFIERCWHQSPEARPSAQECFDFWKALSEDEEFQNKYAEKKNQDNTDLLYKILPPEIANQLKSGEKVKPMDCPEVTILFSDIVGFTNISSELPPAKVMDMLSRLYSQFDALTTKHDLFKVETIGDAYMVAGGIFNHQDEQAERIAMQGLGMIRAADKILIDEDNPDLGTIKIRVGCHTGPVVASVVGDLNPRFCLFGDTVNFASRMESTSLVQRMQCTKSTQKKLMAEVPHFVVEMRGLLEVKGKGKVSTYFIESTNPQAKTLTEEFPHAI